MDNTSIWVRIIKHGRIAKQETVPASHDAPQEPLFEALRRLDLPKPMWLDKNQREWDDFNQTRFTPDDFVEHVDFDRMELEYINPAAPKAKSRDPRNEA